MTDIQEAIRYLRRLNSMAQLNDHPAGPLVKLYVRCALRALQTSEQHTNEGSGGAAEADFPQ